MLTKIKGKFRSKNFKKISCVCASVFILLMSFMTFASAEDGPDGDAALTGVKTVVDTMKDFLSVGNIAKALAFIVSACLVLFFFWWGARKVIKMLLSAFKKGKISV